MTHDPDMKTDHIDRLYMPMDDIFGSPPPLPPPPLPSWTQTYQKAFLPILGVAVVLQAGMMMAFPRSMDVGLAGLFGQFTVSFGLANFAYVILGGIAAGFRGKQR